VDHDSDIRDESELGEVLDSVASTAEVCAAACLEAIERDDGPAGNTFRFIAAAALVAAERARLGESAELGHALSLCARMIDSASAKLDRIGSGGELAAERARSCAEACRRALMLLYVTS
jgi:hypothetical protein